MVYWKSGMHLCKAHDPGVDVGQEASLPHDRASRISHVLQRGLIAQLPQLLAGLRVQLLWLVPLHTHRATLLMLVWVAQSTQLSWAPSPGGLPTQSPDDGMLAAYCSAQLMESLVLDTP